MIGRSLLWIVIFVLLCLSTAFAGGGELVFVEGEVLFSFDGGRTWERKSASPGYRIPEGTCLQLGARSRAGLLLSDGSQIRLHAGSIFCLDRTGPEPPARTGRRGLFRILKGKLWFRNKRRVPKPVFHTPSVVASIRGTEVYLEVGLRERIAVLDGEVSVRLREGGRGSEIRSRRGEVVVVEKGRLRAEKLVRPELLAQWLILVPEVRGPLDLESPGPGTEKAVAAVEALFRWDLESAERLSREALELSPDRAAPYVARALVLQARGRFAEALKLARKALNIDPRSVPAALRTVELLLAEDRVGEAGRILRGLEGRSREERAWVSVLAGYLALLERRMKEAEAAFRKALSLNPSSAYAWLGLGLVQWSLGQEKDALGSMERASLCAPFWSWPHLYLGRALYERRERPEALAELRRAARLDPNDPSPYWVMAAIYRDLFLPVKAVEALEKALALNDNRLAFRSRFLLDQDRAMRNVSLAWALQELELSTWAEARGNLAVWDDPGAAGAYYFRAVKALETSTADPTTLADLRKAHLLSPPNANTYTTYQDYTHFFTKTYMRKGVFASMRQNGAYAGGGYLFGGEEGLALAVQGLFEGNEGPVEGAERYLRQGLFRVKKSLGARSEVLFEGMTARLQQGDFLPWIYGGRRARNLSLARDLAVSSLGFHHRFRAASDLLAQFVFLREELEGWENLSGRGEAVWQLRIGEHRLLFGWGYEARKENERYLHATRIELWDRWRVRPGLWLAAMGGYHYTELPVRWRGRERITSGLGLSWLKGRNLLRAAWFESAEVSTFSGTLFPSELAGFARFSGPDWGGGKRVIALGWDRFWSSRTFTRLEIRREKRIFENPGFTDGTDLWTTEERREVRMVWERILGRRWGLAFEGRYLRFKAKGGLARPDGERHREDWTLRLALTYVGPAGWRVQGALAYFDREKRGAWLDRRGMHVLIPGLTVLRYFADRRGRFFLSLQAPREEGYRFLPEEPFDLVNAPWPEFLGEVGLIWEW